MSERILFSRLTTAKTYHPVSLLSVVSKVLEKYVNNRIVDHLEKCGLFSDLQFGFRSFPSNTDIVTVVSNRIATAFNRSGATRAVALDISKAFDTVWHAVVLHKLKACVRYFLRNFYFSPNDNTSKTMKDVFYFI